MSNTYYPPQEIMVMPIKKQNSLFYSMYKRAPHSRELLNMKTYGTIIKLPLDILKDKPGKPTTTIKVAKDNDVQRTMTLSRRSNINRVMGYHARTGRPVPPEMKKILDQLSTIN
jgi:hypothetical protein